MRGTLTLRLRLLLLWLFTIAVCGALAYVMRSVFQLGAELGLDEHASIPTEDSTLPSALSKLEEAMIRKAIAEAGGNRAEAARRLGIRRQLLYAKLRQYGIES
jgi:DNA-binding NtrC family response regulator